MCALGHMSLLLFQTGACSESCQYESINSLLGIFPSVQCMSPQKLITNHDHTREFLDCMTGTFYVYLCDCLCVDALNAMMNLETFTRVLQYLHQHTQQRQRKPVDLTKAKLCLELILKYDNCS